MNEKEKNNKRQTNNENINERLLKLYIENYITETQYYKTKEWIKNNNKGDRS